MKMGQEYFWADFAEQIKKFISARDKLSQALDKCEEYNNYINNMKHRSTSLNCADMREMLHNLDCLKFADNLLSEDYLKDLVKRNTESTKNYFINERISVKYVQKLAEKFYKCCKKFEQFFKTENVDLKLAETIHCLLEQLDACIKK
jgi:hypothetical protein